MNNLFRHGIRTVFLLLLLLAPALANQVSEWKSSSGSTIRIIGSDQQTFQIQVIQPSGQSSYYSAHWIEVKNSFGYEVSGRQYYCTFNNEGWGIHVETGQAPSQWSFVRWISK